MALSAEYRAFVQDLFRDVGPVQVRRMFGGAGVYLDDACFALIIDEQIYLRGDTDLGPEIGAAGGERWVYENARRGPVEMPYWQLPDSAQDDPDDAAMWARKALVPARKAAAEKAAAKARRAAKAGKS